MSSRLEISGTSSLAPLGHHRVDFPVFPEKLAEPNLVWWVIHTRARHEKQLAKALDVHGFSYFLPLQRNRRSYGARRRESDLPLFPGYLFLKASAEHSDFKLIWDTRHVANLVPVPDQQRLTSELAAIQRILRGGVVEMLPALNIGQRCRVRRGPLRGVEGTVLRRQGSCRLCLGVAFIGQSATIEIDGADLEAIE